MEWEESSVNTTLQNCQETPFNGDTLFCSNGGNGTREMKKRSSTGGGIVKEVTVTPCPELEIKWEPRNPLPDPFLANIWKVNQNLKSRQEFRK